MAAKNEKDGKTKETATRRRKAVDAVSAGTQESTDAQSSGIGVQRLDSDDSGASGWGDRGECYNKPINATPGEVLEHLGSLESRFYKYVHAHQERLDTRLKESEAEEQDFRQEAELLRHKILSLLSQEEDKASSLPDTKEPEEPE